MKEIHSYVPAIESTEDLIIPSSGEVESVKSTRFHRILFGGDQLTSCRSRGIQKDRISEVSASERFEGLIAVSEDWHTKCCLLEVSL